MRRLILALIGLLFAANSLAQTTEGYETNPGLPMNQVYVTNGSTPGPKSATYGDFTYSYKDGSGNLTADIYWWPEDGVGDTGMLQTDSQGSGSGRRIDITRSGGGVFTFHSLSWWNFSQTTTVTLTGYRNGTARFNSGDVVVLGGAGNSYNPYAPAGGWSAIDELRIVVKNSGDILDPNLDNFVYTLGAVPTVSSNAASSVSASGATLNGTANANGDSSSVSFNYGTTTGYGTTVTATPSPVTGSSNTAVSASISGLSCNTTYHFRVSGSSIAGTANGADQTFTTGVCVPGAPTIGTATVGNAQASVTFSAPASNGGTAITGYTVTANPGGQTGTGAASPITVTGLTNGTAYTFTVTATNGVGTGSPSAASNSVTPKAAQTITFANPGTQNFGTTPTLSATADSGLTPTFSSSSTGVCTITAGGTLTFVSAGTCTVAADQAGNGSFSAAATVSQSFTVAAVAPGAPTIGTATAGNAQASVSFSAPASNGGAAITGYTVTASPGGLTGSGAASPITVTGLTNGTAYTFTVIATTAAGTGSPSAASNSVTPKAAQTITFANPGTQNFGTTPTLSATADSGLSPTFSTTTTSVCAITAGGALTFITAGTCTVAADQAGNGTYSAAATVNQSFTVAAVVPGAPTVGTATAGNAQASVAFSAPAFTGGASITYTVTSNPGGLTGSGAASPITVAGLTNGIAYTFTVTATNSAGTGSPSGVSNSITPRNGQSITFANPGTRNFGTTPTLTASSDSGLTVSFTSSTPGVCAITSGGALTFATTGACSINAEQAGNASYSAASTVSRSFTVAAVVPGAPAIGTVTIGNSQASVAFSAPAFTGGAAIAAYTVTSSPGGLTASGASSPIAVTGLNNGTAYTFTVTATNSAGTGPASGASASAVFQGGQIITFANPGAQAFGTTPTLAATADSGLPVSFTSSTPGVCTITTGGAMTFIAAGTCTVNANQPGNAAYSAASTVSQSFPVTAPTITLAPNDLPSAIKGTAYSQTISAMGGIAPYSFSISAGALPAGLSLSSAGVLSGTPSQEGTFAFTVTAADNNNAHFSGSRAYTLTINPQAPVAGNVSLTVNAGSTNNAVPLNIGGGAAVSVAIGSSPSHGTAAANGSTITYTPAAGYSGSDSFTYTVTNATATSAPATVSILVQSRPDPSLNPEVKGLLNSQVDTAKRFAMAQIGNFLTRLEGLHAGSKSMQNDEQKFSGRKAPRASAKMTAVRDTSSVPGESDKVQYESGTAGRDIASFLMAASAATTAAAATTTAAKTAAQSGSGLWPWSKLNLSGSTNDPFGSGLEIWSAGTLDIGRQSDNDSHFTTSGISVGGDYRASDNLILGVGAGLGHERQKIGDNDMRSDGDGYSMVIYGSYQPEKGFFVDGLVGYNRMTFNARRHASATGGDARSQRKGTQWFTAVSGGYEYRNEGLMLSPYGRLTLISNQLKQSTESGAGSGNLVYFDQIGTTAKLAIGARGETRYEIQNGIAKPYLRIEYQHDFAKPGIAMMAYADQLNGPTYQLDMGGTDRNLLVLGLGCDFASKSGWGSGLSYRFSHGNSSSSLMHTFSAHIQKGF